MREILFKGKDIRGNWHIGLLAHIGNAWYISNKAGTATAYEVIPNTIGQYTGLTDKNGKKIFEGDIVERLWLGEKHIYRIYYDSDIASFIGADIYSKGFTTFDYDACKFEVIGNTHDNPELLLNYNKQVTTV